MCYAFQNANVGDITKQSFYSYIIESDVLVLSEQNKTKAKLYIMGLCNASVFSSF